jgi:hypothetical protein
VGEKGEPKIEAVDLAHALAGLRYDLIEFASAGGGESGGVFVAGAFVYRDAMPDWQIKERSAGGEPPRRVYSLSPFLASPAVVINGHVVKRRDVVKYVANKLGGAHLDSSRKSTEDTYRLLDSAVTVEIAGKSAVYFELVSIGQAVARSEDARRLRDLIM